MVGRSCTRSLMVRLLLPRFFFVRLFVALAFLGSLAFAEEQEPEMQSAHVVGLSLAYQAPLDLPKVGAGAGLVYTREYFVTRRTALGVHLGVRMFPDAPWHFAFGYGVTFKHYLGRLDRAETTGPYLLYGLLLQMNVLEGRRGAATDHDTRLALGYDWRAGPIIPLVELGYHITQLRNFDEKTVWWPYGELVLGLRF